MCGWTLSILPAQFVTSGSPPLFLRCALLYLNPWESFAHHASLLSPSRYYPFLVSLFVFLILILHVPVLTSPSGPLRSLPQSFPQPILSSSVLSLPSRLSFLSSPSLHRHFHLYPSSYLIPLALLYFLFFPPPPTLPCKQAGP